MDLGQNKAKIYRRVFIAMWALVLAGLFALSACFVYVARTKMPDTQELENPEFEVSSIVYSADGIEIDRYFSKNRQWVTFEELSPLLVDALVATEDHRYFRHSGIDANGTARAFAFLGRRGGASTITQQLAKQFFTPVRSRNPFVRVWQKMKEWVIAVEFERRYTKEEIIAMFLNKFDFIYNANGVGAAANVYFGKDQRDITVEEAAVLIGMLKNPYYYNPVRFAEKALKRRNIVLSQMHKNHYLDDVAYDEAVASSLDVSRFRRSENYSGMAPYFMSELKKYIKDLLDIERIRKPGGERYDLDVDGLTVHTTIDTRYQKHAERAMREHMAGLQETFFKHRQNSDPWTYQREETSLEVRSATLNSLVEQTERYRKLRTRHLDEVTARILAEVEDARLTNTDIVRMLRAEQSKTYFSELKSSGFAGESQIRAYKEVLASELWPVLKSAWQSLKKTVKEDFQKPYEMEVFSYSGPRKEVMSPLDSIKYMAMHLQLGSLGIDPANGHIRYWVGGIDYNHWKYDHVTTNRQVGSTFKPFLYTAAIMNAYSPCYPVRDIQYTIPKGDKNFGLIESWSPKNSKGEFSEEEVTLKEGLKNSLNSVSVWLMINLESVQKVIDVADRMGIDREKIPPYPSMALGTPDLSVFEMTAAYATFANNGIYSTPVFIDRIVDASGALIYQSKPSQRDAISPNHNYAMVDMLKYAGSFIAPQIQSEFGGKTGTTNDHVDGWFMGITPHLVAGTWVGGQYPWIRFLNIGLGQGAVMARPFFVKLMQAVEADRDIGLDLNATFQVPPDMDIELDCAKYQILRSKKILEDEIEDEFN